EMLGLRQSVGAKCVLALKLGGGERRQLQRGAERKAVAAELEMALEQRRYHQESRNDDTLIVLQRTGDFGRAETAVAFAENEFRRTGSAVFRDVERDDLGHRLGIAMYAPEEAAIVGLGCPAPAGADRIDQDQIGESQPSIRIIDQADMRTVPAVRAEFGDARPDQSEIEERRCRA